MDAVNFRSIHSKEKSMKYQNLRCVIVAVFAVAILQFTSSALADEGTVNFSGKDPSDAELINALTPPAKTRGIKAATATTAGAVAAPSTLAPAKASFDQVTFELGSDRLSPTAKRILDKIGRVLSTEELSDVSYIVEGHTDVTGSLPYNMKLSQMRAEAVKRYLVEGHKIDGARLQPIGKGPTDLLDKDNPKSGVNRRVVFEATESE
jgi:outer membrane protein OmpA-like peptidoglycan-associated protein